MEEQQRDEESQNDQSSLIAEEANDTKKKAISKKRTRITRNFPASTFDEALELPTAIQKFAAGQKVRRITLFDHLKKSPDSGTSRMLITNASKYGLIKGSYSSEYLELTVDGAKVTNTDTPEPEKIRAKFNLAIARIRPFNELYENYKNIRLPSTTVLQDFLIEKGYSNKEVPECIDTFIVNAKSVGILRTLSGAERFLPIEQVIEEIPSHDLIGPLPTEAITEVAPIPDAIPELKWNETCFYITPIGVDESEERKHSDLFLHSIVEPALKEFKLKVIRADNIGKPGMITSQVIEHIIKSKVVIADLSFHNPNVFYELALRHACRLPTVQIIRSTDNIPFDLDQFRTIRIDTSSIYTLVPQLDVYKSEIANQVRRALGDADAVDNPITAFCPGLKISFK